MNIQEISQLAVALTGLGSTVLTLINSLKSKRSETKQDLGVTHQREALETPLTQTQRYLDLSIVLAASSVISILMTYALAVSGRIPSWTTLSLASLAVSSIIALVLLYSWRMRRWELSLCALSMVCILVLVLSPGGALSSAWDEGEDAISLFAPLWLLTAMIVGLSIYVWGNPFSSLVDARTRLFNLTSLVLLISVSVIATSIEYVDFVFESEKAPRLKDNDDARLIYEKARQMPLSDRRLFYQLASEITLVPYYEENFSQVTFAGFSLPEEDGESIEESIQELQENIKEMVGSYTKAIEGLPSPEIYLLNRISWVHPLGDIKRTKASIQVPGVTSLGRLQESSKHRIFRVFSEQPELRKELLKRGYSYPSEIVETFQGNPFGFLAFGLGIAQPQFSSPPELLPEFTPHSGNALLIEQMALPERVESFIALAQYRSMLLRGEGNEDRFLLIYTYDALPAETKRAFSAHLNDDERGVANFKALREFSKLNIDFEISTEPTTDAARLAALLPQVPAKIDESLAEIEKESGGDSVVELAASILRHLSSVSSTGAAQESLEGLHALLSQNDPDAPVINLFTKWSMDLISGIERQGFNDEELKTFIWTCANPIGSVVISFLDTQVSEPESRGALHDLLERFLGQDQESKEALMALLSHDLYRIKDPKTLMTMGIAKASAYSYRLDLVLGAMIMLPLFLLAVGFGGVISGFLRKRDVLRSQIAQEGEERFLHGGATVRPQRMIGRRGLLTKLAAIAKRGASSIAIVGPRGAGKTRLLQEIVFPSPDRMTDSDSGGPFIGVWITAPAVYDEKDFVRSVFCEVARRIEDTLADHLGALTLEARTLEERLRWRTMSLIMALLLFFQMLLAEVQNAVSEPLLILALMPTYLLAFVAVCVALGSFFTFRSVDLSRWMQSKKDTHLQSFILYRETISVLQELGCFPRKGNIDAPNYSYPPGRKFVILASTLISFILIAVALTPPHRLGEWILVGASLYCCIWAFQQKRQPTQIPDPAFMALIRHYKSYTSNAVRRIKAGALGQSDEGRVPIAICIDELDKIIDIREMRDFLRRIKGIFEVPGVHYYVSIAQDAYAALHLGAVQGRDEFDSSFDHVFNVGHLDLRELEALVSDQFALLGLEAAEKNHLALGIAIAAFGSPRDALRICDGVGYISSNSTIDKSDVSRFIGEKRSVESQLLFERSQIDNEQWEKLGGRPLECISLLAPSPSREDGRGEVDTHEFYFFVLALLELALETDRSALWEFLAQDDSQKLFGAQVKDSGLASAWMLAGRRIAVVSEKNGEPF